jgi:putative endonuclease
MRRYWVYILASHSRRLHVGVTAALERRMQEHRAGEGSAFTRKYRIHRLVYFASFSDVRDALRREKEIKGWTRAKKLALVESENPGWRDLPAHLDAQAT